MGKYILTPEQEKEIIELRKKDKKKYTYGVLIEKYKTSSESLVRLFRESNLLGEHKKNLTKAQMKKACEMMTKHGKSAREVGNYYGKSDNYMQQLKRKYLLNKNEIKKSKTILCKCPTCRQEHYMTNKDNYVGKEPRWKYCDAGSCSGKYLSKKQNFFHGSLGANCDY